MQRLLVEHEVHLKISPRPAGGAVESLHNSIRPSKHLQIPAYREYSGKIELPKTGGQLQFVGKYGTINTKERRAKEEKHYLQMLKILFFFPEINPLSKSRESNSLFLQSLKLSLN